MRYFYILILNMLLLASCSINSHKNQSKYDFVDKNNQVYQIQTDFENLDIHTQNSKDFDKITLLMFLDLDSQVAKDYILNLNHLQLTFPKVNILGILTQPVSQEKLQLYIKENDVNFMLLNPTDNKKNLFTDFAKKINSSKNADFTPSDTTKENTSLEIPYFILYDKYGKKYQTYSGTIAEEMFAYDINTMIKN